MKMAQVGIKLMGGASFRSFRCLWMLEEIGINYEHVLSLPQGQDVKKYNPLGKIPVLIIKEEKNNSDNNNDTTNEFVLYESAAINTYLGDLFRDKNPTLVPLAGTKERGLYEQTMSVLNSELDAQGLWMQRKHAQLGNFFGTIPEAVEHARKYFHKTNRTLIQQLKDSRGSFLLGENFTAADIFYVHCLDWSKAIGWDDKWKNDPTVMEYLGQCKTRPSYLKVKAMRDAENSNTKRSNI